VIFVDSNVPMYLVGAEHPNKHAARRLLERSIATSELLVSDVEVVQEILHRYASIGRRDAIAPCVDALLGIADEVFDITLQEALRARELVLSHESLSARDAIHVAVMERHAVQRILSFDRGFDAVDGIERIGG